MLLFLSTPSARRATFSPEVCQPLAFISIHALREEGDVLPDGWEVDDPYFYPRPPRGGRLPALFRVGCKAGISIHALREEGDILIGGNIMEAMLFLSTPSARRATFSAPPAAPDSSISIHALREEGDAIFRPSEADCINFYPRPPRGGRPSRSLVCSMLLSFLSTPSARRATNTYRG